MWKVFLGTRLRICPYHSQLCTRSSPSFLSAVRATQCLCSSDQFKEKLCMHTWLLGISVVSSYIHKKSTVPKNNYVTVSVKTDHLQWKHFVLYKPKMLQLEQTILAIPHSSFAILQSFSNLEQHSFQAYIRYCIAENLAGFLVWLSRKKMPN